MKSIYLTIILITAFSCSPEQEKTDRQRPEILPGQILVTKNQFENAGMELGQMKPDTFATVVRASGMIDVPPENRAEITAVMGGFVKQIPLLVGNEVNKGELLVVLENPDYIELQQEFLEVAQQLKYLKSDFERQQKLFEERITSEKNFLKAEGEYNQARARYAGLKSKLAMLGITEGNLETGSLTSTVVVRAPVSGTVTRVNVSLGTYVNPSDIIMEVVNPSHKHLELIIYEKDIMKLAEGQPLRYRVPEASPQFYEAEIALIGKSVDQETRTINVHAHLLEEDEGKFTVGMFVEAEIFQDSRVIHSLPESAVLGAGDERFILKLEKESGIHYIFSRERIQAEEAMDGRVPIHNVSDSTGLYLLRGGFSIADQSE